MLKYLHIENIAVISRSGIEFNNGFNVLTGETGAGKSIIIDSLYAVLGHRTSKELIRHGCDSAFVSAVFGNFSKNIINIFSEAGVAADDDGNFLIERKLSLSGNGYIKINGVPVSANLLKGISKEIINIHGQHDNQDLLDSDNHFMYIDRLAQNEEAVAAYKAEFKTFNFIRSSLKALEMDEDEKLRRIDILKFQIEEISSAQLRAGEMDELKERLRIARNCDKRVKELQGILALLKDNGEEIGAISKIKNAVHIMSVQQDNLLHSEYEKLLDALEYVNIAVDGLENKIAELCSEEYDVNKLGDRLSLLTHLSSKYGKTETEILKFLDAAKNELKSIMFNDSETERLENELILSQERLIAAADKLSESRRKAAVCFEKSVKSILAELNMPSASISVEVGKGRYSKNGCDEIQFLFSANAGEANKPLAKIASGGELSRVMLAIKSVLADKDEVDTLIFDEIDSGISGRTADKVGVQLKKVAANHQVICVTHLAQIAVCADNHLLIDKAEQNGRTFTDVKKIDGGERVNEIARIMRGTMITDTVLASARELLGLK